MDILSKGLVKYLIGTGIAGIAGYTAYRRWKTFSEGELQAVTVENYNTPGTSLERLNS